jgi:DNA-binding transcriptional regulator YhcF (GntR family)
MDHIFNDQQPIYQQIIQRICAQILRGELKSGDKLPSVVDAAMQYKVNHNTIFRVYSELVRQEIAVTRRGEGTFITENQAVLGTMHQTMREALLENFFTEMARLGYSTEEILAEMQSYAENISRRGEHG